MSDEHKTNQITLTAEQLLNILGHAATQEQLDNVRRELDGKIESTARKLDAKIEKLNGDFSPPYQAMLLISLAVAR